MKPSTRQRFLAIAFDFPPPEAEVKIVSVESGLPESACHGLVHLGGRLRDLAGQDLEEGVSTRLLVYCAKLIRAGMPRMQAIRATLIEPLSDDEDIQQGLMAAVRAVFG